MKIKERELEDWLVKHPSAICPGLTILERQLQLDHGRLDLLAWDTVAEGRNSLPNLWVIELKVTPVKEQHIGQVLRYAHDVQYAVAGACFDDYEYERCKPENERDQEFVACYFDDLFQEPSEAIMPVLIGTSITPEVRVACEHARIMPLIWEADDQGIYILRPNRPREDKTSMAWAAKTLPLMRARAKKYAMFRREWKMEQLFTPQNDSEEGRDNE